MRRRAFLSLAAVAATALPAAAAAPAGAEPIAETISIETSFPGVTLNAAVRRPDTDEKVPILLTYTPYASLGDPEPANDSVAADFLDRGYARVVADTPGTHGSTGCWDYGGPIEQQTGVELVEQLAKLPWSNGKVAMLGVSYEGTTANMVAARGNVPGLAAIVPEAAISRWYGYAFQDGVRYGGNTENLSDEGFDTPIGFDGGFGRTLSPDPSRPQFSQAVIDRAKPCDSVAHTQEGYSRDPDYGAFWLERDYIKDAAKFRVPVLVAHGWQDENVRQSEGLDLYEKLPVDDPATSVVEGVPFKRLYMFQAPHASPEGDQWPPLLEAFLEHTLKGVDNGIDKARTQAYSFTVNRTTEAAEADVFPTWPPPRTGDVTLQLGRADGAGTLAPVGKGEGDNLIDLSNTAEDVVAQDPSTEATWLTYATAPLTQDIRIAGSPKLDAVVRVDSERAQLAPVLLDVDESGSAAVITRGFMDLRYREGLDHRAPIKDEELRATVRLAPQDQTISKGHRLVLIVAGSDVPWAVPEAPGTGFAFRFGDRGSALRLPIVGAGTDAPAPVAPSGSAGLPTGAGSAGLKPSRRALTVRIARLRTAGGRARVRLSGRAPRGVRVTLKLRRGSRVLATRRVRASRSGTYRVVVRLPARTRGVLRVTATAKVRGRTLVARAARR